MGDVADWLISEWNWYEGLARAMENAQGYCEYCQEDLLVSRLGYSSIVLDHILPKKTNPEQEWNFYNQALSCSSCNIMKGGFNPLKAGEYAEQMVHNYREKLVQRVRERLNQEIEKRTREWKEIRRRIRS